MSKILVCGLLNVESTVNVREFPVHYSPIEYPFNQVGQSVGGVGFNVAKALKTLGDEVDLLSFLGEDLPGKTIRLALQEEGISEKKVLPVLPSTPLSVVLYDYEGDRKIYCDLKDVQERNYPSKGIDFASFDVAVLTNANFSRNLLAKAKEKGCLIATDVQAISSVEDEYNADFMANADILFFSNACLEGREESFVLEVVQRFGTPLIGVGLGEKGALLYDQGSFSYFPVKKTREVVSTVGAGDALFSAFLHFYLKDKDSKKAMEKAVAFASYKVGEKGASEGFLKEEELLSLL